MYLILIEMLYDKILTYALTTYYFQPTKGKILKKDEDSTSTHKTWRRLEALNHNHHLIFRALPILALIAQVSRRGLS